MVLFADMKPNVQSQSSPRPISSAPVPGLPDCSLLGGDKSTPETGTVSPPSQSKVEEFDITVSNLPEKLGFSPEFRKDLKAVGGSPHALAERLLDSLTLRIRVVLKLGVFVVLLSN